MNKTLLAVLVFPLLTTVAFADEWSKKFPVTGHPELSVSTGDGMVRVRTWDRNEIEARVTTSGWKIASDEVRVIDHQTGNRVELEVRIPNGLFSFGHRSVTVELQVPRDLTTDIRTGDGEITVEGLHGETHLATGDGAIRAEGLDGKLDARTGDGGMHVRGRFDQLTLQTGDGSIEAESENGSKMSSGWNIRSGDGSVRLRLPATLSAQLDVQTGDGGIHSGLPLTDSSGRRPNELRGKLNGGGPILSIRTGDGSVTLDRL